MLRDLQTDSMDEIGTHRVVYLSCLKFRTRLRLLRSVQQSRNLCRLQRTHRTFHVFGDVGTPIVVGTSKNTIRVKELGVGSIDLPFRCAHAIFYTSTARPLIHVVWSGLWNDTTLSASTLGIRRERMSCAGRIGAQRRRNGRTKAFESDDFQGFDSRDV